MLDPDVMFDQCVWEICTSMLTVVVSIGLSVVVLS